MRQIYLYLSKASWTEAWVNGGLIPIKLASEYRSIERTGIFTPDENLQYDSPFPLEGYRQFGIVIEGDVRELTIEGNTYNGLPMPDVSNVNRYFEDGLILSFSTKFGRGIAKQLGKEACVEIVNLHNLKVALDRQLGKGGIMKLCKYTEDHRRNHFLKSVDDAWQCEYRLLWPGTRSVEVNLPKGVGRVLDLAGAPD